MALTLTAPASSPNDTIVVVLASDEGNFFGVSRNDFTLRRADTNAAIGATITVNSQGGSGSNYRWNITVAQTGTYTGAVYLQLAANSITNLQSFATRPSSALNSNQFRFRDVPRPDPPSNFAGTASVDTARLVWDTNAGETYEVRRDGGAWADATSPHQVTGLSPETAYTFQVRVKASAGMVASEAVSLTLTTLADVLRIENIDEQFIILGTRNYELVIDIGGNPDTVDAKGHMEGFNSHWDAALQRLYIRADEVTRLIGGVQWDIMLVKGSEQLQREIKYNVIPPGVIFHDLPLIHLYRDVLVNFDVIIENIPPLIIPTARLLGLKSELLEHGLTVQGTIPGGSVFASDKGNTEIIVPLETGGALKREYPYMIEAGSPPAMNVPTFTPRGDYGLLDFDPVTHALGYEWTLGEVNADTAWNDTRPVVDPSRIEVTPGNLEVSLKFPIVSMASSYEYRLDSESHTREWTRFEGVLDNGFIGVVIPNLQDGVEYDLSIRVRAPWIGSPVSIKVFGGRIAFSLDSRSRTLYQFHTGFQDGGIISRMKRWVLPTQIRRIAGLAVRDNGDVYIMDTNDGSPTYMKLYVFPKSVLDATADNATLRASRTHSLLSSTWSNPLIIGMDFLGDTLAMYISNSNDAWNGYTRFIVPESGNADISAPTYSPPFAAEPNEYGLSLSADAVYTLNRSSTAHLQIADNQVSNNNRIPAGNIIAIRNRQDQAITRTSFEGLEFINQVLYAVLSNNRLVAYRPSEDGQSLQEFLSGNLPSGMANTRFLSILL